MRKLLSPLLVSVLLGFAGAAHAELIHFTTALRGDIEAPPNASPGAGIASLVVDDTLDQMRLHVDFAGLLAGTTASHVHCCTEEPRMGAAPVATMVPTFVNFPLGVNKGIYDMSFDLQSPSTYNPEFITAHGGTVASAQADLLEGLGAGTAYFNIHTTQFPGGEIRGFFVAAPIPEPSHLAMLAVGLAALAGVRRWRRQ